MKASKPLPVEDDINSALRSCYASTILGDDDNLDAILEKHIPTDDDISSGLRRLQTEMRADQKMFICGSCGIRDFEGATSFVPFSILQPDQLTLYSVRDPLLCDDPNTIGYVMEDESWYHLHPNIDTGTLMICSSCKDYVVKKEAVPPWSLAGGCDYGQIPEELRSLSTVESMVISQVIPFGTLIKLSADGGCRLKGHIISFQHQTSSELCRLPNVSCLADRLIVQFSGTRNQLLLLRDEVQKLLSIRPAVVFGWLRFLKHHNLYYQHIDIHEDIDLEAVQKDLLARIIISDDDEIAEIDRIACGTLEEDNDPAVGHIESIFLTNPQDLQQQSTLSESISKHFISLRAMNTPICEFSQNDQLFLMAFPHLFILGKCLPSKGSFSPKYVRHLLLQHDGRFSQDHRLLFLLFNQLQRHRSIAGIHSRIKAKISEREHLQSILNDEDFFSAGEFGSFTERIERDPAFRSNLVSLLRFVEAAGNSVPYSPAEAKTNLSRLSAMMTRYGVPSFWITISPGLHDSPLAIKLLVNPDSEDDPYFQFLLSPDSCVERNRLLSADPVLAARIFHKLIDGVLHHLLGLDVSTRSVHAFRRGCLGVLTNYFLVFEGQSRGALHMHGLFWGSLKP
ncbi:MAG: DUF6570 domain-containing protein, partial [Candidatus Paceibacterota bacterium]